jgi:ABC-2 type transport system permease protein
VEEGLMATTDRAADRVGPTPAEGAAMGAPTSAPPAPEGRLTRNLRTVGMVWHREIIRFRRSPARIVSGLAQPVLFLFVLGAGIKPLAAGRVAGGVDFQQFIFPGVIAMSVLFSSLFSAISIVWDREFGFLREMLVAPVSRTALVIGKAVGSGSVAVAQGLILLLAAPIVGVSLDPAELLAMFGLLLLLAFSLNAFGMVVATRMQRMESFQMVMSLVINPMLFLSGAIFPLQGIPTWLEVATRINPATYGVDPIRRVILCGDAAPLTYGDWVVPIGLEVLIVLALGVAMLAVAARAMAKTE